MEDVWGMDKSHDTISVSDVCDVLGRRNVALRVGRGLTAVSNAAVDGQFPASWYLAVREMCVAMDVPCPDRLFKFLPVCSFRAPSDAAVIDLYADPMAVTSRKRG